MLPGARGLLSNFPLCLENQFSYIIMVYDVFFHYYHITLYITVSVVVIVAASRFVVKTKNHHF